MSDVPVVPGDDRTACQHCSARVTGAGVNPDGKGGELLECAPGLRHKPMPEIKAGR